MVEVCSQRGRAKATQKNTRIIKINQSLNVHSAQEGTSQTRLFLPKEKTKIRRNKKKNNKKNLRHKH